MKLYLVQHAEAISKDIDPERPLSKKGAADAAEMAAFLHSGDVMVDEVIHSGKARAKETANILSKAVWLGQAAIEVEGLKPNDSTDHLFHAATTAGGDIMAVGHLPFMEKMVSRCLTGKEDGMSVGFEPGTVVCLERTNDDNQGGWQLNWMQRPSMVSGV
ncbi:MAG: phosphohistidine phosphatase SixA [Magnetovibrio sp.]|nr:phosphohistidine phosphatase SixA [Magnetovibrio sp.]